MPGGVGVGEAVRLIPIPILLHIIFDIFLDMTI